MGHPVSRGRGDGCVPEVPVSGRGLGQVVRKLGREIQEKEAEG